KPIGISELQEGQILIGKELAERLGLRVGDTVTVAFMRLELGLGGVQPKFAAFKVAGTFQSHISEYDRGWAFIPLADGLRIARAEGPEFLEVRADRLEAIDEVKERATKALGPGWLSSDLRETNKQLFAALKVEKWIFTGILSLIVCIAAFNIDVANGISPIVQVDHADLANQANCAAVPSTMPCNYWYAAYPRRSVIVSADHRVMLYSISDAGVKATSLARPYNTLGSVVFPAEPSPPIVVVAQ
ncbi:MAG: hypothetical protein HY273_16095, partial [Gammaproteobacteria bacterium]|nr:hypothetical protein [Gammaproteobacteria bacterium]